ncbi:MAG: carbonic anhydrase family protein [Acidobacteria bacterium]|nr:carbonic anhydrase family protein [Acidobacteriota bacterium]
MQISSFRRLAVLSVGLLLAAACAGPPAPQPRPVNCCNVPWGYQVPENWASLSPCYEECRDGGEQSPIDFVNPRQQSLNAVDFSYGKVSGLKSRNDGHKIIIDIPQATAGGVPLASLKLDGVTYILQQFHFHTPSEHKIRGNERPIEIHFVNVSPGGRVVAIGVFVNRGTSNPELAKIWRNLPGDVVGELDLARLLPAGRTSFRYTGSLTNPPCGQGFQWIVYHDAIELNQDDIQKLRDIFSGPAFPDGNRRQVQPLNGRVVVTDVPRP